MATLKICINKQRLRADGVNPVYIRVMHRGKAAYIKTDKMVSMKGLTKELEVKDPFVLQQLSSVLVGYMDKLNRSDISRWTALDIAKYLREADEDLCFSDYARTFIERMADNWQGSTAVLHMMALHNMERYFGNGKIMFSQLTSHNVNQWIASLTKTARAKYVYPALLKRVFMAAVNEVNDYDKGIIRIKTNPWVKVKIPEADIPEKRAISAEACRAFFSAPLPEARIADPLAELGRDVALMVLCLAGINTVDLYNLRKVDYRGGIIHYLRAKTKRSRSDNAYIEMRVPELIKPLFAKYQAGDDSEHLFIFAERFCDRMSFNAAVNLGIAKMCRSIGMEAGRPYSTYTFRHTWATTAQNDCGATLTEVGFAMNHSQRSTRITRGYVIVDFSPAWELNEKVVDFIFFSDKRSKAMQHESGEAGQQVFRISPKMLIRAAAFFKGRCLASFEDIGYSNIDEVIEALAAKFPDDIPARSMVQFKIVNLDNEKVAVYERMKGKGF